MAAPVTEAQFEKRAQAFLEANAKPRPPRGQFSWGEGPDTVGLFRENTAEADRMEPAEAKAWRAKCYDAGFIWVSGPPEFGGRGLPAGYDRLWAALESRYDVPSSAPFAAGLGMVVPTMLAHAREEVKRTYLPRLWRGDIIACQLFSEPEAGSDLAGIKTKAVRAGDDWLVNGQKVWTSGAHYSDLGLLLARTSSLPDRRHRGLTMFLVDMHAPGVEVRPLRQMTGGSSFNEVFLTDVRIADDMRLGDVDDGWQVAITTLMNERAVVGGRSLLPSSGLQHRLYALARHLGRNDDPVVRQLLAQVWIRSQIARYTRERTLARLRVGQSPGPENSIAKLFTTQTQQLMSHAATVINGPRLTADAGTWGTYAWSEFVLGAPGARIGGGTDEIMRNTIAERVLGLPKG